MPSGKVWNILENFKNKYITNNYISQIYKSTLLTKNPKFFHEYAILCVDQGDIIPLDKNWSERPITVWTDFANNFDKVLSFEGRYDDTWVVTTMKSGTTWTQELAWLILNNYDFETASRKVLMERSPYVE